jgi:hypothetical protein
MSADNFEQWLKRFRTSDAQEDETADDSAGYRALLHQPSEPKARNQPETQARKQPETRARTPKP